MFSTFVIIKKEVDSEVKSDLLDKSFSYLDQILLKNDIDNLKLTLKNI